MNAPVDVAGQVVGSFAEAFELVTWHQANPGVKRTDQWLEHCPRGWRYLGMGYFRVALVAPSGTVYKLPRGRNGEARGGDQCNRVEVANLRRFAGRPWAPAATLWDVAGMLIVAMPHITSDEVELSTAGREELYFIPITDMNDGNYVPVNGRPIVIDAGEQAWPQECLRDGLCEVCAPLAAEQEMRAYLAPAA